MKPILPSLKEKKRYIAFQIISKSKIKAFSSVAKGIKNASLQLNGDIGTAKMGLQVLPEKYRDGKGIVRVNAAYVDELKASLTLIQELEEHPALIRSVGISGILNKAEKYLAM